MCISSACRLCNNAWEELQQIGNVITIRVHKNISYATFSAQKTIRMDVHSLPSLYNRANMIECDECSRWFHW